MNKQDKYIIFFILVTIVSRVLASYSISLFDDAFITLRYSRNLAEGIGYVYNSGEFVLGVTGPLWGLILSPFFIISNNPLNLIVFLNIIFDALIIFITLKFVFNPNQKTQSYIFAVLYIISPITARICVGGMEVNLFILLSIISIILFTKKYEIFAVVLSSILYFIRPEGVILFFILLAFLLFDKKYKMFIYSFIISSIIVGAFVFAIYMYYGHPVSQSLVAKSNMEPHSILYILNKFFMSDFILILSIPFLIFGVFAVKLKSNRLILILFLWMSGYLFAYLLKRPMVWTWYPAVVHYITLVFAAFGFMFILHKLKIEKFVQNKYFHVLLLVMPVMFWVLVMLKFGESNANKHIYKPIQKYAKSNDFNKKTIMASDIGIIGYAFKNSYIYDTEALVTPDALNYNSYRNMILEIKPDYISVIAVKKNIRLFTTDSIISANYIPIERFSVNGEKELNPDIDELPVGWIQDYIIFKKK